MFELPSLAYMLLQRFVVGDFLNQGSDLSSEKSSQFISRRFAVLDGVVQDRCTKDAILPSAIGLSRMDVQCGRYRPNRFSKAPGGPAGG